MVGLQSISIWKDGKHALWEQQISQFMGRRNWAGAEIDRLFPCVAAQPLTIFAIARAGPKRGFEGPGVATFCRLSDNETAASANRAGPLDTITIASRQAVRRFGIFPASGAVIGQAPPGRSAIML